ncbi:hypothetical protein B1H10_01580 [candidate division KSB1 bacterium 4484_188]|nr:MAG: hypothetical protein B1H10_01580 [candidate division KSB1 bacterium 4484_188]
MASKIIPEEQFEFFYLTELTRRKIKPLSRWEKPVSNALKNWLRRQGLNVETVPRITLSGTQIPETIFSTSSRYLDYYSRKFSNKLLSKSAEVQRIEGFLFGYPSCCVSQFIRQPYTPNRVATEDQRLLFHWICPGCRATPDLLNYYRTIHRDVREWYRSQFAEKPPVKRHLQQKFAGRALAAAVAVWLSAMPLFGHSLQDSTHFIPVPNDVDADGLAFAEEVYLGSSFMNPRSFSGINDMDFWTQYFKTIIDSLPTSPQPNVPYKLENFAYGIEVCQKCGATVNMGFVKLVNPLRNLEMDIPFIGLHFLENNCFSYDGNLHTGRIDIDTLKQILFPYDPAHLLNVTGDSDGDGLTDSEEDSLYLNPNNPDTDGDGVPDGAQVAEQLTRLFPKLKEQPDNIHSSITYHLTWGLENCVVCGSTHNMGFIELQNPENGRSYQVHLNGLHALAQGSFAYDGTVWHNQRSDAVKLYRTMKTHLLHIENDSDNDGLTDAEEVHFGFNPNLNDTNGDGVCDGMELALSMKTVLDSLPTTPQPLTPYVLHHPTFGFWNCLLCGEPVNMGFMEVVNPIINCPPLQMSYYAYHFLGKGSFAYEGRIDSGQWIEGRIDPVKLETYLGFQLPANPNPPTEVVYTFKLKQNYPNPFNGETVIKYEIQNKLMVKLEIYDVSGRKIRTLVNRLLNKGEHEVRWNGRDDTGREVAGGVYVYRLKVKGFFQSSKMLLIR